MINGYFAHVSEQMVRLSLSERLTPKSILKSYVGDNSVDVIRILGLPVTQLWKSSFNPILSWSSLVIMNRKQSPLALSVFLCFIHWYCCIDPALVRHNVLVIAKALSKADSPTCSWGKNSLELLIPRSPTGQLGDGVTWSQLLIWKRVIKCCLLPRGEAAGEGSCEPGLPFPCPSRQARSLPTWGGESFPTPPLGRGTDIPHPPIRQVWHMPQECPWATVIKRAMSSTSQPPYVMGREPKTWRGMNAKGSRKGSNELRAGMRIPDSQEGWNPSILGPQNCRGS